MAIKPVIFLIEQARAHPARALPTETHQSYPIPVVGKRGLHVVFLYCPSRVTPGVGLQLLPPTHRAIIDAETGEFEEIRIFESAGTGLGGGRLGVYRMPDGIDQEEFERLRERLLTRYDQLLPRFVESTESVSTAEAAGASEFDTLFPLVSEEPLREYYKAVGKSFFEWLRRIETPRSKPW